MSTNYATSLIPFLILEFESCDENYCVDERKVHSFRIRIQISTNIGSRIRTLPFQGENAESLRGADGKDVKHSIKGSPGSSQLS